jgi:hypothetical protein
MTFLVSTVIGLCANERRRKRNWCEVSLDAVAGFEGEGSPFEDHLHSEERTAEELIDDRRFASAFHHELTLRLAGDDVALAIVDRMMNGVETPADLGAALGRPVQPVREARRRVRYHAEAVTKDLSASAPPALVPTKRRSTKG